MSDNKQELGWIGIGRMGFPMAERLLKAGHAVEVWNRTRAKAEPLEALGASVRERPKDLAGVDVLFTMVSTRRGSRAGAVRRRRRRDRRRWRTCRGSWSTARASAWARARRSGRGSPSRAPP